MKLVSWNVNGIRAVHNKGLFVTFLNKVQPDVICLQETKAMQGQAELDLAEYEEYWSSAEKKGYSGTAIFVKKGITVQSALFSLPEDISAKYGLKDDAYGDPNREGRVVAVELADIYVVTVYTPNSKPDLSRLSLRHKQWDPAFLEYIERLEEKKPVVWCGDLNVAYTEEDLANPEANRGEHGFTDEEREGFGSILKAGYIDSFRYFTPKGNGFYTWWSPWRGARSRNIGWRIDYWLVSKKLEKKLKKADIHADILGSDHCPVSVELSL